MVNVTPSVFKVIQIYGGLKAAYVEATVTAADVIVLGTTYNVSGIKMGVFQAADDGAFVPVVKVGTNDINLTVGTGPSAELIKGIVYYREY